MPDGQLHPLGGATPETPGERARLFWATAICYTVASVTVATCFTIVAHEIIPPFLQIFTDFHTDLPDSTKILITFTGFYMNDYGWVAVWLGAIAVPILLAWLVERPADFTTRQMLRRFVWLLGFVFTAALAMFMALALLMPHLALIGAVAGGR